MAYAAGSGTGGSVPGQGWAWTMAYGALFAIAGLMALLAPGFTTVALVVLLGWVLLITGIAGIVMGMRTHNPHRRAVDLLYGIASVAVAMVVLFDPVGGAASLTLLLALWLAFRGVIELHGATRTAAVAGAGRQRGTLVLLGVVDLLLAVLLFANFPFPAVQVLGVFVGASILLAGVATMIAADQLRRMAVA